MHVQTHTPQHYQILAEELDEAALAVRFVVLLFECALVQLFKAEGADEMLGVKLLAHGGDAAAGNGFLTAGAEGAAALVVMSLTVGLPFMLEETAVHKRNETLPADKTLRVPKSVKGRNIVLQDGTSTAATFGGKHVEVVLPTVRLSLLLMETLRPKE